jgi:hypothetical protein
VISCSVALLMVHEHMCMLLFVSPTRSAGGRHHRASCSAAQRQSHVALLMLLEHMNASVCFSSCHTSALLLHVVAEVSLGARGSALPSIRSYLSYSLACCAQRAIVGVVVGGGGRLQLARSCALLYERADKPHVYANARTPHHCRTQARHLPT